jgi:FKBP-type peptidyl-prolyl cis-trans isomerase
MKKAILILIITIILIVAVLGLYFLYTAMNKNQNNTTPTKNTITNQTTTIQGMKIETLTPGNGVSAKTGDRIVVDYMGKLTNGYKFDSSYDRNTPFSLTLGQGHVIPGWELGLIGMKVGEKRQLTIPPKLAYGSNDIKDQHGVIVIPKNSTLIFEIELLKIN